MAFRPNRPAKMNSITVAFAVPRDPLNGLIRTRIDERCPTAEDNGNRLNFGEIYYFQRMYVEWGFEFGDHGRCFYFCFIAFDGIYKIKTNFIG